MLITRRRMLHFLILPAALAAFPVDRPAVAQPGPGGEDRLDGRPFDRPQDGL